MVLTRLKRVARGWPALVLLAGLGVAPPVRADKPAGPGKDFKPTTQLPSRDPFPVAAAIDREIDARLQEAGVPVSPRADDAEFLRRVCLDLAGRLPSAERAAAFLASPDPDKRRRLIDELLAGRDHAQQFAVRWRLLLAPPNGVKGKAQPDRFSPWLADQIQRGRGWDQVVTELLTVAGDVARAPEASFLLANSENFRPQANQLASAAARLFLGVRLGCAECHDHPFAPWKQADFWGTAAFFSRLRNTGKKGPPFIFTEDVDAQPRAPDKGETPALATAPGGAVVIPAAAGRAAGKVVKPRFLGGAEPELGDAGPMRPAFAAWVTAPDNPFFAPALVNRVWAQLFGRGLVSPVDDFRDDNPPSHPAVVRLLADEFRASGYDTRQLFRCVCNSQAYQRTSRPLPANAADRDFYSHMAVKPLTPEAFYDSLANVLTPQAEKGRPGKSGKDSSPAPGSRDDFIQFFRAQGDSADENSFSQGIPHFLRRLNGELFNRPAPLVERLVRTGASREQALDSLYLATLTRRPTAEEVSLLSEYLSQREPEQGYAGVLWILLNSGEFALNH